MKYFRILIEYIIIIKWIKDVYFFDDKKLILLI